MNDIVDKMIFASVHGDQMAAIIALESGAAEVKRLREVNADLLAALEIIETPVTGTPVGDPWAFYADLQSVARAARIKAGLRGINSDV